jgi:predicted Zn-dependent protease
VDESNFRGIARLAPIVLAVLAIGFVVVKGCQSGPFGRRQVVALSPEQEARLGAQAYQEVLAKEHANVVSSGPVYDAVKDVADRLIAATRDEDFLQITRQKYQPMNWEVRVLRSKQINAFCLPGGKIVVYTAILKVAETDAGLATVMGHEISHALAHHGAERMAQTQIAQIGLGGVGASLGDMDSQRRAAVLQALNFGAQAGLLKYSRSHESEADKMGLFMMAVAGYDPEEAVRFWERMSRATGRSGTPEFLSTHPNHGTRISDLKRWMKQALPLYERSRHKTRPKPLPLSGTAVRGGARPLTPRAAAAAPGCRTARTRPPRSAPASPAGRSARSARRTGPASSPAPRRCAPRSCSG